jgi:hypothetical protein
VKRRKVRSLQRGTQAPRRLSARRTVNHVVVIANGAQGRNRQRFRRTDGGWPITSVRIILTDIRHDWSSTSH